MRGRLAWIAACALGFAGCGEAVGAGGSEGTGSGSTSGSLEDPMGSSTSPGVPTTVGGEADEGSTAAIEPDVPGPSGFAAGFDVADITPSEAQLGLNIYMGSYGLPFIRGPAQGVHDPIFVRSFALGIGSDGLILAVTDLPGMGNRFTREVRAGVAARTGLAPHRVLVATTHTHAAPDFQGLWGGGPAAYRDPAIEEVVASMGRAWEGRQRGTVHAATTVAPNNNRRDWGFTDDELTLLAALDETGAPLGVLAVFAAHPTVLGESNLDISRDWCGYAVDAVEQELGVPALLFNGILGDASPAVPPGPHADDFERASAYGLEIADAMLAALDETEPITPELVADHRQWTLVGTNTLFQLAAQVGLLDYDYQDQGGQLSVDTQSTYVRLGEQVQLVTFPGEPLTRLGLPIKDAMTAPHRMVLGQTGDALGYFVPGDEWMTGHNADYEESISLGPGAGDTTRDVLIALIEADRF